MSKADLLSWMTRLDITKSDLADECGISRQRVSAALADGCTEGMLEKLFAALADGLTMQGANVIKLGLCSTPMSYFANGRLKADGSIMITASHNPGPWNGFKLCREQAIPISGERMSCATCAARPPNADNACAF